MSFRRFCLTTLLAAFPVFLFGQIQAPVIVVTNTTIRVMAANLSSGNNQRYETPGLNILKGLKPDIVAIQEFNYSSATFGTNTTNALREMINNAFGTNFVFVRETGKSIPNGVISRFPILTNGVWDDVQVPDREFVWAKIDLPGTNELYVVSVHLHSGGGASSRAVEAANLKSLIQANFPADAFIIVAGDFNTDSRSEAAINTFKTFLKDDSIPSDEAGNRNTNEPRSKPYDYVLPSFSLQSNHVITVIGSKTFANGLVFDSEVYSKLSEVPPIQAGDSHVAQMQHMAVVKDFRISRTMTNFIEVAPPRLSLLSTNILRWAGQTNVVYRVQSASNLTNWLNLGSAQSSSTNFSFTNSSGAPGQTFYRVLYP